MPLKKGKSKKVIGENISEFHTGETYARTKKKFGKAKADKQAVAVAMSEARRSGGTFGKKAGHNPPKPHHAHEHAREKDPKAAHTSELVHHANATHREATGSPAAVSPKASHTSELIHHAHHTHREVRGAAGAVIPRHMRGRGLISEKAMAFMSKQLAAEAQEPSGPHIAAAGKSHAAKRDATAARPEKGQHKPREAKPPHGRQDAAVAE